MGAGPLRRFLSYLKGKVPEIQDLETKDLLLAKVVLDIHRKRTAKAFVMVPLWELHPVHAIDHAGAIEATRRRAATLRDHRDEVLARGSLDRNTLSRILPSISWFKVVQADEHAYIAYEGNGRLAALKEVFAPEDGVLVEVELYRFRNPDKIVRRLNRVRRLNDLID